MIRYLAVLNPIYITFFWAIVLTTGTYRMNRAKFFLGIFMMVAFLLYTGHAFYFTRHFAIFKWYEWVYTLTSLSVFPMYYHYVRLLTVQLRLTRKALIHYLPALISSLVALAIMIAMGPTEREYYTQLLQNDSHGFQDTGYSWLNAYQVVFVISRLIFGIQVFSYMVLNMRLIRKHNENITHYYSNPEEFNLKWAQMIYIFLVLTSLAGFIFNILGRSLFLNNNYILLIPSVIFATLLFIIGLLGNRQVQVVKQIVSLDELFPNEGENEKNQVDEMVVRLENYFMSERAYLNKDLKIWEVSKRINSNRTYVSGIINKQYGINFCSYVNRFRVEEAQKMLIMREYDTYTIEHIGGLSGFGSLNSFIRAFQKEFGTTPGKYREKRLLAENRPPVNQ